MALLKKQKTSQILGGFACYFIGTEGFEPAAFPPKIGTQ